MGGWGDGRRYPRRDVSLYNVCPRTCVCCYALSAGPTHTLRLSAMSPLVYAGEFVVSLLLPLRASWGWLECVARSV